MKRRDIEGPIQRAIVAYLGLKLPGAIVSHTANEVAARGANIGRAIARAKSIGMTPGMLDLTVIWRGHIFFLEVKAPGGAMTDGQRAIADRMTAHGAKWAVVKSIDDVAARLAEWGIGGGDAA